MTTAAGAMVFGTRQDQLPVALGAQGIWRWLVEAGPTGTTVELGFACEQRQITTSAVIPPGALLVIERAGERALRPFFAQDVELGGAQAPGPLRLRQDHAVCARRIGLRGGHGGAHGNGTGQQSG